MAPILLSSWEFDERGYQILVIYGPMHLKLGICGPA